jgi:murein DD-endopeptidase MepM/ murein hydrolase activator NlpD
VAALFGAAFFGFVPFSGGTVESPAPLIRPDDVQGAGATPSVTPAPAPAGPDGGAEIDPGAADRYDARAVVPGPLPLATLAGYRWPLPRGRLTLPFGPTSWGTRWVDGRRFHDGIDLATFCGDRIVAAHGGVVLAAGRKFDDHLGWLGDLGPYYRRLNEKRLWGTLPIVVVIDDGNGYRSVYAHFSKVVVKAGQRVKAGRLLGYEGATGHASGCHLHYSLFSPAETRRMEIRADVVKRLRTPRFEIARVDPLPVLGPRPAQKPKPAPAAP